MSSNCVLSVGIDIGTSTTQVIFSRLTMENTAGYFSVPRVSIVEKEVVYKSPVHLTPLIDQSLIDGDAVREIVAGEFAAAGVTPADTGTGAVIITGESARKENAALVLEKLSDFAGDFVVSTAGPDLESAIAGKGSGAARYSEETGEATVNLDIGGGTTNVALFCDGEVAARGCVDIGGRQVRLAPDWTVTYLSGSAQKIARFYHLPLETGQRAGPDTLKALCAAMAQLLEEMLGLSEPSPLLREVETPGSARFAPPRPIRAVCFSGGVADCIYRSGQDALAFGDIGVLLGDAIRRGRLFSAFHVIPARETIRATVVGAGTYTTSISGSTIAYDEGLFPLKNIPVLRLSAEEQQRCFSGDRAFLEKKVRWFLSQSDSDRMVLAMEGKKSPSYGELRALAGAAGPALDAALAPGLPLILVVHSDMAKALGQTLKGLLPPSRPVIAVDSIRVEQGDFLDLGRPLMGGLVIPVVVKTLIFG
ncbi:MAG: ethanolamine ammonia-lyase reactivating factor EutA [Oscillospiraceae bacterium]|nr:ethanolamine ammonia-lyase reactivating factor EutA [Oscillospiraceae bacterium]